MLGGFPMRFIGTLPSMSVPPYKTDSDSIGHGIWGSVRLPIPCAAVLMVKP